MKQFKSYLNLIFILIALYSISCNTKQNSKSVVNTIDLGDQIAVGDIDILNDSIFNGEIKFYDKATKKIMSKSNYVNGVLHGPEYFYYENGKVMLSQSFSYGKQLGNVVYYDSAGAIFNKTDIYYDIKCGSSIDYFKGSVAYYYFYSFDKDLLFYINYDSIQGKKISDIQKYFFFIQKEIFEDNIPNQKIYKYFMYLIDPPKYSFKYSLVLTDENYHEEKELKKFQSSSPLDVFYINQDDFLKGTIKLIIFDSTNNLETTMYKRLSSF